MKQKTNKQTRNKKQTNQKKKSKEKETNTESCFKRGSPVINEVEIPTFDLIFDQEVGWSMAQGLVFGLCGVVINYVAICRIIILHYKYYP